MTSIASAATQNLSGYPPFPPSYKAVALGKGVNSNLEAVALGTDGRVYRVAWQCDPTGIWKIMYDNDLSSAKGQYSQIVLATGSDKALQLLGLCSDASDGQHPNEI